jgi:hypothetical protein
LALTVDALLIGIPFHILVVWLYAATGGAVQVTGIRVACHIVEQPNHSLDPSPPKQANFVRECRSSSFGFETSRSLIIGRVVREGGATETVSQTYSLGSNGQPRNTLHLDWLAQLALLAYLITMEHRTGGTLGKYTFRIEVVSWKSPGSPGIPLISSVIRQSAQWLGLIPVFALGIYEYVARGHFSFAAYGAAIIKFFTLESATNEIRIFIVCSGLYVVWCLCNLFLIIAKRDPLYDRLARVAVLTE